VKAPENESKKTNFMWKAGPHEAWLVTMSIGSSYVVSLCQGHKDSQEQGLKERSKFNFQTRNSKQDYMIHK